MNENLFLLYDEAVLEHNRNPYNFEKRPMAQHILEAYNPLCGDKFKIYLDVEENVVITATFHGYGCAVSKAATSVLIQQIEGKRLDEISKILSSFFHALNTEGYDDIAEMQPFLKVRQFPERLTCVTLSWEAAQLFLNKG